MPASKRIVTINLGMQTVTMAVFEASGDSGLVLAGVSRADLLPDPAADASRSGQLKIALGELRANLKHGAASSAVAVPSQGVFVRFVKIPEVDSSQVGQMLFFEAQQNVPYPIEEVSWCFQVLPDDEKGKLGAIILATKVDQLEAMVGAVREAGYTPEFIESSPTALYNALRYNYPDLAGCALLVDIGARATNLIFVENDRLFVRTLPMGGNTITTALQKRFENRSLAAVEETKVSAAFIPPPGHHENHGSEADEIGKIARTVMTRIHNEITRSITFYRTNQQGSTPTRVFLAGGGVSMPYTLEFFNEKLSLPIEFFNPLRRVAVAPSADPETVSRHAHSLGECVGLASRALVGDCPLEVNFQSPGLQASLKEKRQRPYLMGVTALLAAILGLFFMHFKAAADRLADLNDKLGEQVSSLQGMKQQLDALASDREKLLKESADLVSAPMLRTAWLSILNELSSRLPVRNIWITQLAPLSGEDVVALHMNTEPAPENSTEPAKSQNSITALSVKGLYLDSDVGPAVVDAFVENLIKSELFDIPVDKKSDVVRVRTNPDNTRWAYDYQLVLPLRRPIPL